MQGQGRKNYFTVNTSNIKIAPAFSIVLLFFSLRIGSNLLKTQIKQNAAYSERIIVPYIHGSRHVKKTRFPFAKKTGAGKQSRSKITPANCVIKTAISDAFLHRMRFYVVELLHGYIPVERDQSDQDL